jgi:hypothetical protein
MKPIYILSLHGVRTGGPEATHQLSDALIEQGFDARMVYYDMGQIHNIVRIPHKDRPNQGGLSFGLRTNTIEDYARYKTNPCADAPDEPSAIIVIPESVAHLAAFYTRATVLVWWLSVDNAFGALAHVSDEMRGLYGGINLDLLRRPNIKHAVQSSYARDVVAALRFPLVDTLYDGKLGDYTTDLPTDGAMPMLQRPLRVAVQATPHKVVVDVDAIAKRLTQGGIECVLIGRGPAKSREEIIRLFWTSRVYLDLGNMPGDDRMPREARMLGCQVIDQHRLAYWKDTPPWDAEAVANAVADAVSNPDKRVTAHHGDNSMSASEKRAFFRDVSEIFSAL